jgi:hypothetical protein
MQARRHIGLGVSHILLLHVTSAE